MKYGCHLSPSAGFLKMAKTAISLGADTFQFFLRNPRGSKAKPLDKHDVSDMLSYMDLNGFHTAVVHSSYTLNPCSPDQHVAEFAKMVIADDFERMHFFPGCFYNLHPGSHVGSGVVTGLDRTGELLRDSVPEELYGRVLIETMSGQGTEIGSRFEEIKDIISIAGAADIGVCLDTCHVFAAGYDIVNHPDKVLDEFDRIIGVNKLRCIHANDSLFPLGTHKDRHAAIGKGYIGLTALRRFLSMLKEYDLPVILETPHEVLSEYAAEIEILKVNEVL